METIEDIVREKRETADEIERKGSNQFQRELAESLRKEADRIEAAWRQDMMAFGKWLKERHNLNVLSEEMERYVERELERDYGND